jgi:K+-sensing histidine kinase KdpD
MPIPRHHHPPQGVPEDQRAVVVAYAAIVPLLVCAAVAAADVAAPQTTAVLLVVVAVAAAAATGIRAAGLTATASGVAWFYYFLTEPTNSGALRGPSDLRTALLLLLVGAAITELAAHGSRRALPTSSRTRRAVGSGPVDVPKAAHEPGTVQRDT